MSAQADLVRALEIASGVLAVVAADAPTLRINFTGKWAHLGSMTVSQALDQADAALGAAKRPEGVTAISEDDLTDLIKKWFTEDWHSDAGDKWQEDVLLTGCRKVGNGRGYQQPEHAAENLRRDLARAIIAHLHINGAVAESSNA